MTEQEWIRLERVLIACGMGHLGAQRERFTVRLESFVDAYRARVALLKLRPTPALPTPDELVREYDDSPHRVRLLLQAIGFGCSDEMLTLLWLASHSLEVSSVEYEHRRKLVTSINVTLSLPDGGSASFRSDAHLDTAVLRFLGVATSGGKPVIDGVFPLAPPRSSEPSLAPPADMKWMSRVLEWVQLFGGHAFCPSVIDQSHVAEVANAIVTGVSQGWLATGSDGTLAKVAAADPAARHEALARLTADAATDVSITRNGRRALRRLRFSQQLEGTSRSGLTMLRDEIERVLAHPNEQYEPDELDEIRDELYAVRSLLGEPLPPD